MATLTRTLSFRDLTLLIIGTVIGSGIFLVPGTVLVQVQGEVSVALAVWVAGGFLSLLGALTYGELSATNPDAGGLYIYIRDCFGRLPAFLFGWALFFAISGGSAATLAVAFSDNIRAVVPMNDSIAKIVSVGMIAVVAIVNVRGTRQAANMQNVTTAIKVGAILLMSAALILLGEGPTGSGAESGGAATTGSLVSGFGLAMIGVLWAYEGWQYGTFSAGETLDAKRNFPRAFLVGTSALITIYLLANVGYLAALGPGGVAGSKSVAAASVALVIGPDWAKVIAIAIAISIFSATNGITLTSPRVYYAMARDGLFFSRLAQVHPRFKTPAFAIIAGSAWAAVLALLGTFQQLLTYVVFSGWIFYALGAASIFVYRKRIGNKASPYRVPGYPWTPLLFIGSAMLLVANTLITQLGTEPRRTLLALGIILVGVPAYFIWRGRSKPRQDSN